MQTVHVKKPLTGHAAGPRRDEQSETKDLGHAFTLTASKVFVDSGQGSSNSDDQREKQDLSHNPTLSHYGTSEIQNAYTSDSFITGSSTSGNELIAYAFSEDENADIPEIIESTLMDQFSEAREIQSYEMLIDAYYQKSA